MSTAPERPSPRPSLAHRAEYGALRAVIGATGALPWSAAVDAGGRFASLGYRPLGIRRRVVERQIAAAFPEMAPTEVLRTARACYQHLGRVAVETALLSRLAPADVLAMVDEVTGWDVIERVRAGGRGFIGVSGHLGNWELSGAYVAARGIPTDVIVRGMGNPLFDRYLRRTRERLGLAIVQDREAVRRTARSVAAGRMVAFLADQAGITIASTYVPFFGRAAKTPRGPAVLARRLCVPLVFGAMLRRNDGRYRAEFEEIAVSATDDIERDIDDTVARYTAALERAIRRTPEQYFWHHRRWKRPPPGTPAEQGDPT